MTSPGLPIQIRTDAIKFPILFFIWAAAFFPVFPNLYNAWFGLPNSDNSYGALVPIVSLYLIWKKKGEIKKVIKRNSKIGLGVLTISLIIYLISYTGGIVFIQRLALVLSLNGLVLYIFGLDYYKAIMFPLLFLLFMVPLPDSVINIISFPLQTNATIISAEIIKLFGIPVFREGHMLYFTQTQLEVAEACSGIRSISAILMLSVIFMHQCDCNKKIKSIIVSSSIFIAFFANIVRITGTGILAHFFGAEVARGFLHEFSGIAVFVFGLLMIFLEYCMLKKIAAWKVRTVKDTDLCGVKS